MDLVTIPHKNPQPYLTGTLLPKVVKVGEKVNNEFQDSEVTQNNNILIFILIKSKPRRDFPSGPVENPPSNAGDTGSIPGQGTKIPHAAGQLSPRVATTEPMCSGACTPQLERSPCTATKSPCAATKTRHGNK